MFVVILTANEGAAIEAYGARTIEEAKQLVYSAWCEHDQELTIWRGPRAGRLSCVATWNFTEEAWVDYPEPTIPAGDAEKPEDAPPESDAR